MTNRLNVDVVGALLATLLLWASAPPESPVADAAMRGDVDEVRALLQDGADVNAAHESMAANETCRRTNHVQPLT